MILKVGDKIYCVADVNNLTKNKIKDDTVFNWWFGQIGESEPWINWFVSEKEWLRNLKLKELGI